LRVHTWYNCHIAVNRLIEPNQGFHPIKLPIEADVVGLDVDPPTGRLMTVEITAIRLWQIAPLEQLLTLEYPQSYFNSGCFSLDGRFVAAADWTQHRLIVWDTASQGVVAVLRGHREMPLRVCFLDDDHLLSGDRSGQLMLWHWRSGRIKKAIQAHRLRILSLALHRDQGIIASGSGDGEIRTWTVPDIAPIGAPIRMAQQVNALAWNAAGSTILTGSGVVGRPSGKIGALQRQDQKQSFGEAISATPVKAIESIDDQFLIAEESGQVTLINSDLQVVLRLDCTELVDGALVSTMRHWGAGLNFALATNSGVFLLETHVQGRVIAPLEPAFTLQERICALRLSHDGSLMALALEDGAIEVWRTSPWRCLAVLGDGGRISAIAFNNTGARIAAAYWSPSEIGNNIVIWDIGSAAPDMIFNVHEPVPRSFS
jgi:hypothetical protein